MIFLILGKIQKLAKVGNAFAGSIWLLLKVGKVGNSGIPEAETFGRKGKFSAFGLRFRPPKLKAEYGRNSRKALDFVFPSVFQDENIMAWFSKSIFGS